MSKTARDLLVEALEDLGEDELKRFRRKLNEFPVKRGYDNIPRGRLEKADALDLADLLLSFYTEEYAAEVAAGVLRDINCKRQAEKFRSAAAAAAGRKGGCSDAEISQEPTSAFSGRNGGHFVDLHREELIQRTAPVEPVLDCLHGKVLTDYQYQKICAKETNQEKMRELYKLMPSWNNRCKDQLYEALKAKNPFLIEDLELR